MEREATDFSKKRREEILQRSPFISSYLDFSGFFANEEWQQNYQREKINAFFKMDKILGSEWFVKSLKSSPLNYGKNLFNPHISLERCQHATYDLFFFGAELENIEDINLFAPDIHYCFLLENIIDPNALHNESFEFVKEMMLAPLKVDTSK